MAKSPDKQPLTGQDMFMAGLMCDAYLRARAAAGFTTKVEAGWDTPQKWSQTAAKVRGYSPTVVVEYIEAVAHAVVETMLPWDVAKTIPGMVFQHYCGHRERDRQRLYEQWRGVIDARPNPYPLDAAEFLWRLSYAESQIRDYSRSQDPASAEWREVLNWPVLNIAPQWCYILGRNFPEVLARNELDARVFWHKFPAIKMAALHMQYPPTFFP